MAPMANLESQILSYHPIRTFVCPAIHPRALLTNVVLVLRPLSQIVLCFGAAGKLRVPWWLHIEGLTISVN